MEKMSLEQWMKARKIELTKSIEDYKLANPKYDFQDDHISQQGYEFGLDYAGGYELDCIQCVVESYQKSQHSKRRTIIGFRDWFRMFFLIA